MHPILFRIGSVEIRSYGFFVALAVVVAFYLLHKEARRKNFYADKMLDMELIIVVFGIIGARLLHVLVNLDFYTKEVFSIFLLWGGGLAIYGGIISAVVAGWVFAIKKGMPFWETADFIIPYIVLGQSIGRIGCFLNGCCFGRPAALPFLGVIFPGDTIFRYPTQIYASVALLGVFVILRIIQQKPHFAGCIFFLYLALYTTQRFFIDFLRGDNPTYALGLTISQIISIIIFLIVLFPLMLKITLRPRLRARK